jgi:hypothetical protein
MFYLCFSDVPQVLEHIHTVLMFLQMRVRARVVLYDPLRFGLLGIERRTGGGVSKRVRSDGSSTNPLKTEYKGRSAFPA